MMTTDEFVGVGMGDSVSEEGGVAGEIDVGDEVCIEEHWDRKKGVIYNMCEIIGILGSKQRSSMTEQFIPLFHEKDFELSID